MHNTSSQDHQASDAHPSLVPLRSVIKQDDGFLAYYFSAQLANLVIRLVRSTFITPNQLTSVSLLLGVVAAWLYSRGDWKSLVIGAILHHVSFILDCADGQLARVRGIQSQLGGWFDFHSDKIKDILLLVGLAWGVYAQTQWIWILPIAVLTLGFQFLRNISEMYRQLFSHKTTGQAAEKLSAITAPQSQFMTTIKNSIMFKLADRTLLLTVAAFVNQVRAGVLIYFVLVVIFAIGSGVINYRKFRTYDLEQAPKQS